MYIITNVYGVLVFANYEMKKSANQIQCIWICTFFSFAFRHNNRTMLIHSGMVFATIDTAIKSILTACDGLYNRRHNTRMSSHIACLFKIQIHSIPSALSLLSIIFDELVSVKLPKPKTIDYIIENIQWNHIYAQMNKRNEMPTSAYGLAMDCVLSDHCSCDFHIFFYYIAKSMPNNRFSTKNNNFQKKW